jgi:hypothetical protein
MMPEDSMGSMRSCLLALSIYILTAHVSASPLPPIIRAATSNNGRFLVVATLKLGPAGDGGGQPILGETFEVNERVTFPYSKGNLTAPNKYYLQDLGWKVELPRESTLFAPWPIVSDDGSSLILVGVSPAMPGTTLLTIYKRNGRYELEGSLLRSYKVDDLWTLKPGEERMFGYTDATPEWFDDGVFSFSSDGGVLLYKDKEHGLLQISLKSGAVTHCSVGKAGCGGND